MLLKLRKELELKPISSEWKSVIRSKAQRIIHLLETKQPADREMEEFNRLTGKDYIDVDFMHQGAMDLETFVDLALLPVPSKVEDITTEELIEIVTRAMDVETYGVETHYYMELFDIHVLMPNASSLIFYPDETFKGNRSDDGPTPEEIVEKALAYKPICL
jgi:hypothetical protein